MSFNYFIIIIKILKIKSKKANKNNNNICRPYKSRSLVASITQIISISSIDRSLNLYLYLNPTNLLLFFVSLTHYKFTLIYQKPYLIVSINLHSLFVSLLVGLSGFCIFFYHYTILYCWNLFLILISFSCFHLLYFSSL